MIKLTEQAVKNSFAAYERIYAARGPGARGWSVEERIDLLVKGERAFDGTGSFEEFEGLYRQLRGGWQVFRNAVEHWSAEESFRRLMSLDPGVKRLALSSLAEAHWPGIYRAVHQMQGIKRNSTGEPSLVAISKFLHFWNPALFVILDMEVMENNVLRRTWLARELPSIQQLSGLCGENLEANPRLAKYLQALSFASSFMRANPHLIRHFVSAVASAIPAGAGDVGLLRHEAVAFEFCLLGLAELPPEGVTLSS